MVDVVLKIGMLKGVGWEANWRYISAQMKGGLLVRHPFTARSCSMTTANLIFKVTPKGRVTRRNRFFGFFKAMLRAFA